MNFSVIQVGLICLTYLSVLFTIAYCTERGLISSRLVHHPVTYIFSLGIFASAWAFYGVIDLAGKFGYGALAYYLGTGTLFLLAPAALKPLMELARRFQINSTADLLTFRYHSHGVGGLATLCMLLAMAPLLALQIQAVAETIHIVTRDNGGTVAMPGSNFDSRQLLALAYCLVVASFAVTFGSNREHHKGLITSMAFESLVKVFGLCAIGLFSLYQVFGGPDGLEQWLVDNPVHLQNLNSPQTGESAHTLLLVFIATAVSMPHIFHMTVVENPVKNVSRTISWAFPLFLLVMALPIFPILWAGLKLGSVFPTEYFPLAVPIAANSKAFTVISFVAGLSAATGAIVAISLSIATMILNHWILPASPLRTHKGIYGQVIWMRRILIAAVVLGGYSFYLLLSHRFNLTDLALTAFIATLQFLPGIIAVAHWSPGNRNGLVAGLLVGTGVWLVGLFIPMVMGQHALPLTLFNWDIVVGIDSWERVTLWSLGLNTCAFVILSLLTRQSNDENYSAELCAEDEMSHPIRMALDIRAPEEIVERLTHRIGETTARAEVNRALEQLGFNVGESRPYALRRLRDEVEANLSGLMGISMATEIMDSELPYKIPEVDGVADINLMESRVNEYRDHLTGLAAELNDLRLYHRRTLEELPMAICSVGKDMEVLMWNSAMEQMTGITADHVTGSRLPQVLEPWGELLSRFANSSAPHFYKQEVELAGKTHWITLHQAAIHSSLAHKASGLVIMLEDVTEMQLLEQELLHSERLASVGRLAAGVAHEIGNPVTGIACIAQNMKYETEDADLLESVDQILSQTDRVSRIVHSLVNFSHSGQQQQEDNAQLPIDLRDCAQEAIDLIKLQQKGDITFENTVDSGLTAMGDTQRMIQVLVNLLSNARDASPDGGHIVVNGDLRKNWVHLSVTDEGTGISPELRDQIFEPFFTTKEPGEGTGLGLAMVYSIVEEHGGLLEIISPVDEVLQKGTKFVIKLPKPLETAATTGNTRR
ncbi:ATP-binding protein [Teredinibacter turnerae]|uniref:histidine kinase n=1 Tax=Teredinibacter turnerae (strain ATCC 39867 / T7901) TaxID=377629 RepID=C5BN68_TERTT|nr:ATP-binding protein [Teredinibacter turnerae]ACR12925.1 Two component sensor signal transduction Histidine kinase [Teredinibacter turnerae T7901]